MSTAHRWQQLLLLPSRWTADSNFLLTSTGCGVNFAFGVYQELYETPAGPFHSNVSPAKRDLMGTRAVSLMTIGAPFASAWTRIYSPQIVTLFGSIYSLPSLVLK